LGAASIHFAGNELTLCAQLSNSMRRPLGKNIGRTSKRQQDFKPMKKLALAAFYPASN